MSSNKTKIIINQHKKNMKVLNAVNYIFLEEINNFKFTKISKYNKSKFIYQKIYNDFILINSLIDNKDFFNSATILRSTYENIMYIIASSYDDNIEIKIDIYPKILRKTVKENYTNFLNDDFEEKYFDDIYDYLCKIVHISSIKELLSEMNETSKYRRHLLCNLKCITIFIEHIYLSFLNSKVNNDENSFYLNLFSISAYTSWINMILLNYNVKIAKSFTNKYIFESDNKYVQESINEIKNTDNILFKYNEVINEEIKKIGIQADLQIKNSKYADVVYKILNDNKVNIDNL